MEMKNKHPLEIMWLGQGGFLIHLNEKRIVIDPYLSNSLSARGLERLFPVPVELEDLRPDVLICTHDHADHFDEQTIVPLLALYPDCEFIAPASVYEHYTRLGLNQDRFTVFNCGDIYTIGGLRVKAVPAFHTDKYAIGMVISAAGKKIYISGDTLLEEGLLPVVAAEKGSGFDLMMICINGKLGNMNADEALHVASVLRPSLVIPMHYGLFAENTADPAPFVHAVIESGVQCITMVPGRFIEF